MGVAEHTHCTEEIFLYGRSREKAMLGADFPTWAEPGTRTVRRKFSFAGEAEKKHCTEEIFRHGRSR